jgi:outer membrane translocation and assembly module TamA
MRLISLSLAAGCLACLQVVPPACGAELVPQGLPTFAELEAQGAKIGAIRIETRNIFDLDDPREDNSIFRLVNSLHIKTRPGLTEQLLLFRSGERVSARLIDETERLLLANKFFYDVAIRPSSYRDGVVDIDVVTRDTWTLGLTGKYSRSGGSNSTSFGVKEFNLLGTGARLGLAQISDAERKGSEFELGYPRAFGTWTDLAYFQARYDDGNRRTASFARPFYELDARWSAGVSWDRWNRIDTIYNASEVAGQFRHESDVADVYAGWSRGIVNRWVQRLSVGATKLDDRYETVEGRPPPPVMPVDHDVRGPYLRYEVIEDQFRKTRNRDQIARAEFVAMGLNARVQVTRALEAWGSDRSDWLYLATASDGFALGSDQDVLASGTIERRIGSSGEPLNHYGGSVRYFATHGPRAAFHASLMADRIKDAPAPDQFRLGGEDGLRGYPLNYQNGDNRVVLTLEERYYTDWYPFRLVRVGGAIFGDVGRAWGGVNQNTVNGGWLSDVGIGLRLLLDRASFAKVLHADIALPLNRAPGVKSVQFHVKTELTF